MVKLHFQSAEEFETLFKKRTKSVTDGIVLGIQIAMTNRKKTARIFEISFQDAESVFEITLPQSQWVVSLKSCLDHYHELNLTDEQIDTWKLYEAAKLF